uniref:Uncharacterized protein n=1 Tax=Glossina pallidipes TaxID=7398 RepID=A0A1A9ZGP7_GLOPL
MIFIPVSFLSERPFRCYSPFAENEINAADGILRYFINTDFTVLESFEPFVSLMILKRHFTRNEKSISTRNENRNEIHEKVLVDIYFQSLLRYPGNMYCFPLAIFLWYCALPRVLVFDHKNFKYDALVIHMLSLKKGVII